MVDLGQQTPMDSTTRMPQGNDVKGHLRVMAGDDIVVSRDERTGGDLEDGLRR